MYTSSRHSVAITVIWSALALSGIGGVARASAVGTRVARSSFPIFRNGARSPILRRQVRTYNAPKTLAFIENSQAASTLQPGSGKVTKDESSSATSQKNMGVAIDKISQERRDVLWKRFEKKYGAEEIPKLFPRILELESRLTEFEEKERNRRIGISMSNSGKKPWNTGRKHSEETKNKIRERTAAAMRRPDVVGKLRANGIITSKKKKATPNRVAARNTVKTANVKPMRKSNPTAAPKKRVRKKDPVLEAQKKAERLRVEAQRKEALARLKAHRGRVQKTVNSEEQWGLISGSASDSAKFRVLDDIKAKLYPENLSSEQLSRLETLTERLSVLTKAKSELNAMQGTIDWMEDEKSLSTGERTLLGPYINQLRSSFDQTSHTVRGIDSRLPSAEKVREVVRDWLTTIREAAENQAAEVVPLMAAVEEQRQANDFEDSLNHIELEIKNMILRHRQVKQVVTETSPQRHSPVPMPVQPASTPTKKLLAIHHRKNKPESSIQLPLFNSIG